MKYASYLRTSAAALAVVLMAAPANAQGAAPPVVHFVRTGVYPAPLPTEDLAVNIGAFKPIDKEFHTKVDLMTIDSGPTSMAALLGGSLDYLICSGSAFFRAAVLGQPIVAVMQLSRGDVGPLMAPATLQSRGTGRENLKKWNGDRWGVTSVGGIAEFNARRNAENAGLKWQDQNVIYTGSVTADAAGVIAGRLDISALDPWTVARTVATKKAFVVMKPSDNASDKVWTESIGWVLAARKETVSKYPKLTTALVAAELQGLLKGQEWQNDPDAVLKTYPEERRKNIPADAFAIYWNLTMDAVHNTSGIITPEGVRNTVAILNAAKVLKPGETLPDGAYDNTFVKAAYAKLKMSVPQ